MRWIVALLACALLAGCDHMYGGLDGGRSHDKLVGASR
jgi:hypothetical protein